MTMWKTISGIIASVCLGSNQAMAIDATWYCSTIFEGSKEPTILKFEVKNGSLFAFTHMQHFDNYFAKREARSPDIIPKEYKITEDTDKSLIAIYAYPYKEKNYTTIDLVLIDKDSAKFRQSMIFMTGHEDSNIEGTCQKGK
jgi:hypothetical protein